MGKAACGVKAERGWRECSAGVASAVCGPNEGNVRAAVDGQEEEGVMSEARWAEYKNRGEQVRISVFVGMRIGDVEEET